MPINVNFIYVSPSIYPLLFISIYQSQIQFLSSFMEISRLFHFRVSQIFQVCERSHPPLFGRRHFFIQIQLST